MKAFKIIAGVVITFGLVGSLVANYLQYVDKSRVAFFNEIENKKNEINNEQMNDMLWQRVGDLQQQNIEIAKLQGYNEGIQALVHKIDPKESQISNIWHAGYQRGMEQTQFVEEMGYEKGYSEGFRKGQTETMKAMQTILKSGDNVQAAIKEFAEKQIQQNDNKEEKPKK